ncbi:unnamed protein product [Cylicocyclus nassatus]|uniref:Uncharacterized protein n=1 Tax=Cylicocyclus nassatus TaxID=53992 RepID=A0AA36DKA2_CYLNA|nr:unnamed protein product [Cylicocyclus nassatus]
MDFTNVTCEAVETPVTVICAIYAFHVTVFFILTYSIFKHKNCFHPFFSIFFGCFMLSYAVSDFFTFLRLTLYRLHISLGEGNVTVLRLYEILYIYASPCAVAILIERLVATLYPARYEHSRPWSLMIVAQLLCMTVAILIVYSQEWHEESDIQEYCMVGNQALIIMTLIILLLVNRVRTRREIGSGQLRYRYQMSENITALQLVIPVIVLDAMLTVVDILWKLIFSVDLQFEASQCDVKHYILKFTVSRLIRLMFEFFIQIAVILQHPAIRKKVYLRLHCWSSPSQMGSQEFHVKNVLGEDIHTKQTSDEHFCALRANWA